jgi:hypothetical protein
MVPPSPIESTQDFCETFTGWWYVTLLCWLAPRLDSVWKRERQVRGCVGPELDQLVARQRLQGRRREWSELGDRGARWLLAGSYAYG